MTDEEKFAEAFNIGYALEQDSPGLLDRITSEENKESEFVQNILMGQRQQIKDRLIEQQKEIKQYHAKKHLR